LVPYLWGSYLYAVDRSEYFASTIFSGCCVIALPSIYRHVHKTWWAVYRCRYSDWLGAGRPGDRIPVGAIFSALVQTGSGAYPASCTMGTGSFPGVKSGLGVTFTPHPLLVPWSRKSIAIPLLPLWAVQPVQSISACTRAHFYFHKTWTSDF